MTNPGNYTSIIFNQIYPLVEASLKKNENKFKDCVAKFFNKNHELVFDIGPYDRIYYGEKDKDELFKALGLDENQILTIMRNIFYFDMNYNPQCAKEPYVLVVYCAIRYFIKTHKSRFAELAALYLCFSGKFYASLHGDFFRKFPPSKYRSVMDYVINNMLSGKYDIKTKGSLFGAIESLCKTWIDTYSSKIEANNDDEFVGKNLQQLRDREKSFLKNIANLYYEAYENKYYLNYETDSLDEDNFRLTSNDASEAARITEATMNYMTSNYVSMSICNTCKDSNVKALELKSIMENMMGDRSVLPILRRTINLIVCDFKRNYPNTKISTVDFLDHTIKPKPNSKDKYLVEIRSNILNWLETYSSRYKVRKKRKETATSYYKCVLMYITMIIYTVAQKFH